MAIKLNGNNLVANRLNTVNVVRENLNSVKVYPEGVTANIWISTTTSSPIKETFEWQRTTFLSYSGCATSAEHINNLPSPSNYVVGDIVRVRVYTVSQGSTYYCSTWAYFRAGLQPLNAPTGSLSDMLDWDSATMGGNQDGLTFIFAIHNDNSVEVSLKCAIIFGSSNLVDDFEEFEYMIDNYWQSDLPVSQYNRDVGCISPMFTTSDTTGWQIKFWFEPLPAYVTQYSKSSELIFNL